MFGLGLLRLLPWALRLLHASLGPRAFGEHLIGPKLRANGPGALGVGLPPSGTSAVFA